MYATARPTRRYIPPGGASVNGIVLNRGEVNAAIARFARKYGWFHATVRTMTRLRAAALSEYVATRVPPAA